jgi:hypothetical protein
MKKHRWFGLLMLLVILALAAVAFAPVALAATGDVDVGGGAQMLLMLISVAVPFVTGVLMRKSWPSWLKTLTAAVLAAGVGVGTVYATGGWTGDAWLIVVACYGVAQVTFTEVLRRLPKVQAWLYGFLNADPDPADI